MIKPGFQIKYRVRIIKIAISKFSRAKELFKRPYASTLTLMFVIFPGL